MQRNGQRPDEYGVFALPTQGRRQVLCVRFAEAFDRGEFEVPISILLLRRLVRDDLDARSARPLQDGFQYFSVVRHNADDIHMLCDQILDRPHLQRWI